MLTRQTAFTLPLTLPTFQIICQMMQQRRGSNSVTNVTLSDQFVSTVSGAEDLHLASTSDAIDAGADLGTTPAGVQYDIDAETGTPKMTLGILEPTNLLWRAVADILKCLYWELVSGNGNKNYWNW